MTFDKQFPWLPVEPWFPANAPLVNKPDARSRSSYEAVIDQFPVETHARWLPKGGATYCNIFAGDVTRALGCEIPRIIESKELPINGVIAWLREHGQSIGWKTATYPDAWQRANMGLPTVGTWLNPNGHGHIVMVRPSDSPPMQCAQAGAECFLRGSLGRAFGTLVQQGLVQFFTHD